MEPTATQLVQSPGTIEKVGDLIAGPTGAMVLLAVVIIGIGWLAYKLLDKVATSFTTSFTSHLQGIKELFKEVVTSVDGVKTEVSGIRVTLAEVVSNQKALEKEVDYLRIARGDK